MKHILTIAAFLMLSACASAGVKIDQSKLTQLQKGKTTYDDVVSMYGKPTQVMVQDNGSKIVYYSYYSVQARPESFIPYAGMLVGGADSENSVVTLNFDKRGVLQSYSSSQGSTGSGHGFEGISQPRNENQPAVVK